MWVFNKYPLTLLFKIKYIITNIELLEILFLTVDPATANYYPELCQLESSA